MTRPYNQISKTAKGSGQKTGAFILCINNSSSTEPGCQPNSVGQQTSHQSRIVSSHWLPNRATHPMVLVYRPALRLVTARRGIPA